MSDTSSVRSYDSARSLSSMGTYGSRANSYSSLQPIDTRTSAYDRSLNYASLNRGNVTNIRDRFALPTSSTSADRVSSSLDRHGGLSPSRYGLSSNSLSPSSSRTSTLERHYDSSRPTSAKYSTTSDYTSTKSKDHSDYGSKSKDYSDYGSLKSTTDYGLKSTSSKLSSRDYSASNKLTDSSATSTHTSDTRSSGLTTAATPAASSQPKTKSTVKSSAASLTPFTSSRVKATDSNLTPFSSRISKTSITTDIDKTSLLKEEPKVQSQKESHSSITSDEHVPRARVRIDSEESSESATEPEGGNKDTKYRYLTSRATSPMEIDIDPFADDTKSRKKKGRRRLLSRTKTKRYDAKPQVSRGRHVAKTTNRDVQVDVKDLDKYCGRVRVDKDKFRDRHKNRADAEYLRSLQKTQYNKTTNTSAFLSNAQSAEVSKARRESEETNDITERDSDVSRKPSSSAPTKQSAFKPKYNRRSSSENLFADDSQPTTLSAQTRQPHSSAIDTDTDYDDVFVPQSSFTTRTNLQKQSDMKKKQEVTAATTKILPLTSENLIMKDSLDKVANWKKQMSNDKQESWEDKKVQTKVRGKLDKSMSKGSVESTHDSGAIKSSASSKQLPQVTIECVGCGGETNARENDMCKSMESMHSFDEVSSLTSEDTKGLSNLKRTQSFMSVASSDAVVNGSSLNRLSKAISMDSLTTNTGSIFEGNRRGDSFIGRLKDIDSFLDFSEAEDFREFSDDDSYRDGHRMHSNRKEVRSDLLSPVDECPMSPGIESHSRKVGHKQRHRSMDDEIVYAGDERDIDNLIDREIVHYKTQPIGFARQTSADANSGQSNLNILSPTTSQPPVALTTNTSLFDNLLDAPVPETPETPLMWEPLQPISYQSQQSLEKAQKDDETDGSTFSKPVKTVTKVNLDDLDMLLDTISSTPNTKKPSKQKEASTFNMFLKDAKHQLRKNMQPPNAPKSIPQKITQPVTSTLTERRQKFGAAATGRRLKPGEVPTANLVDLTFDENTTARNNLSWDVPSENAYPDDYSADAIAAVLEIARHKEKVTLADLMSVCCRNVPIKPPWIVDEEEKRFRGYQSLAELLYNLGVDVKKVFNYL